LKLRGTHLALIAIVCCAGQALGAPPIDQAKALVPQETVTSLIVQFAPTKGPVPVAAEARVASVAGATRNLGVVVNHVRLLANGADLLRLDRPVSRGDADTLAAAVARMPGLRYAVPNRTIKTQVTPSDALFGDAGQWGFKYVPGSIEGANFTAAWDLTTGSASQTIGIVDGGIAKAHEELASQLRVHPAFPNGGYDFVIEPLIATDGDGRDNDPEQGPAACGHGTHVAGTIAAQTSFGAGPAGVGVAGGASASKVLMARALGDSFGNDADAIDAMLWLAGETVADVAVNPNPVRIINMSFGGGGACGAAYQDAFDKLIARGVLPVVAAGNSSRADVSSSAPANCRGALAVAASDVSGALAAFSNLGAGVAITAPGVGVLSTGGVTSGACVKSGTSMAAPHVVAAAALLQAAQPSLTVSQTRLALRAGARAFPSGGICTTLLCGAGLLDARGALDAATSSGSRVGWNEQAASVRENDGSVSFTVSRIGDTTQAATVAVAGVDGTALLGQDYAAPNPATLSWPANDASDKTVTVPVTYRPGEQASRSFALQLNPTSPSVQVASPATVTVRITEVDCATVTPIAMGQTLSGTLDVAQPASYCHGGVRGPEFNTVRYNFSGRAGDVIFVRVNSTTALPNVLDPYVYLLDANRRVLAENDDIESGKVRDSRLTQIYLATTGTYYIDVSTWGSTADAMGSYTVTLDRCGAYSGGTTCNVDADGDGVFDSRDTLLLLRRLAGFSGAAITDTLAVARACATRTSGVDVTAFVNAQIAGTAVPKPLDIDGDGTVSTATDGLMLLRVALGLTGDAVVANATAPGAPRVTWAQVRPYLVQQCGLILPP
jgi:serine protease